MGGQRQSVGVELQSGGGQIRSAGTGRHGNTAASRAEVGKAPPLGDDSDRLLHQALGIGTGDEAPLVHGKGQAEKLPLPKNILERIPLQAALCGGVQSGHIENTVTVRHEGNPGHPGKAFQKKRSLISGLVDACPQKRLGQAFV